MKQELPIAILMLAAGSGLWFWQGTLPNESAHGEQLTARVVAQRVQQTDLTQSNLQRQLARDNRPNFVQPVSFAEPVAVESPPEQDSRDQSADAHHHQSASNLLRDTASEIRNSPPFETQLLATINWVDQTYQLSGRYLQAGQGTRQSKTELHITTPTGLLRMTKICDGRFLYTQAKQGDQQTVDFIDLNRIEQAHENPDLPVSGNPLGWSATGIAGLLENLDKAFEFGPQQESVVNATRAITLRGTWKRKHLVELLTDIVKPAVLDPEIQWDRVPANLPHAVQIELFESELVGRFPGRIVFYRFGDQAQVSPLAVLQFSDLRSTTIDAKEFIELDSDDAETKDETDQYVDQIQQIQQAQRIAAQESGVLLR